jgi:membrane protease YdiL (CAAX protease family)
MHALSPQQHRRRYRDSRAHPALLATGDYSHLGDHEEIIFRGFLLERVAALTRSLAAGAVVSLVIFGLRPLGSWGLGGAIQITLWTIVITASTHPPLLALHDHAYPERYGRVYRGTAAILPTLNRTSHAVGAIALGFIDSSLAPAHE